MFHRKELMQIVLHGKMEKWMKHVKQTQKCFRNLTLRSWTWDGQGESHRDNVISPPNLFIFNLYMQKRQLSNLNTSIWYHVTHSG